DLRLGLRAGSRFCLPVGSNAVRPPGNRLVLREDHAVASDVQRVGDGPQRIFAESVGKYFPRGLTRQGKSAVGAGGHVANRARRPSARDSLWRQYREALAHSAYISLCAPAACGLSCSHWLRFLTVAFRARKPRFKDSSSETVNTCLAQ